MAGREPTAGEFAIVLQQGEGPRVLGLRVRERNARVARRAGCELVSLAEAADERPVLSVPPDVVLTQRALAELSEPDGVRRIQAEGGAERWLLWGPAAALRRVDDPRACALGHLGPGRVLDASTGPLRRRAERVLLRQTGKASDGVVSRNFNRPISRFFSLLMLRLGLRPMAASFVSLLIGVACAWFAAQGGWLEMVVAGALFQFASIFDGVDGEMARATLSESPQGAWIDTVVDNLTYVLCLGGVLIGWQREGIGPAGIVLGFAVAAGALVVILAAARFASRYGPTGSLVFIDHCVERAARDSGRLSLRMARWLFHALRRDVFAVLFFAVSLTGLRVAVIVAVLIGLTIAAVTFLLHWPRLRAAARTLAGPDLARLRLRPTRSSPQPR